MNKISNTMNMQKVRKLLGCPENTPIYLSGHDFPLSPSKADIRRAIPRSHTGCVYAQACKRLFGYTALIYRRVAYVPQTGPDGTRLIYKYALSHSAGEALRHFDRTGEASPNMVMLRAVPISWAATAMAVRADRERELRSSGVKPRAIKLRRSLDPRIRLPWGA